MNRILEFESHLDLALATVQGLDLDLLQAKRLLPVPTETYLTGTYPPLKALIPIRPEEVFAGASPVVNLYLHIPFCQQRCTFCHFAKEIKATKDRVNRYLDALVKEISLARQQLGGQRRLAATVYVGGGTPSQLAPHEMERVFDALHEHFEVNDETEVTFELHPQVVREPDLLHEKLTVLAAGGVNRIAFGAQTLDDGILRNLNRGHTAGEVLGLLDVLKRRGFDNVSVDLMYGLPHETLESWHRSLAGLVSRGVSKLNIFPLFFKVTDPVSLLFSSRPEVFPGSFERLVTHFFSEFFLLDHGFHRGPVLYYSRAEHHSRQQESKFDHADDTNLLGLGVSAFGYIGGTQYYNCCDIDSYAASVERDELPVWRGATLDADELERRCAMFELRSAGIRRDEFVRRFGHGPEARFPDLPELQALGLLCFENGRWRTTDLGAYCVDGITQRFASDAVIRRVEQANASLTNPRLSPLEQHDYSPLGRTGTSVPRPRHS